MLHPFTVGLIFASSVAAVSGLGLFLFAQLFMWMPMKKIPKATYETPEQLAERIRDREREAALLPPGGARQSVLIEIAKLRAYADVKRWLASASPGGSATGRERLDACPTMRKRRLG